MIARRLDDGIWILTLESNLDEGLETQQVANWFALNLRAGVQFVALNCTRVQRVNATGESLIEIMDFSTQAVGGRVVFYGLGPIHAPVLTDHHRFGIVEIRSTEAEAVDFLRSIMNAGNEHP